MSYRRFFDITDLAGVRVEDDDVFDATHALIRDLAAEAASPACASTTSTACGTLPVPASGCASTCAARMASPCTPSWRRSWSTTNAARRLAVRGHDRLRVPQHGHGHAARAGRYRSRGFYRRITGDTEHVHVSWCAEKKLLVMERLFGSELNALARASRP
jgi:hypothetical protein